MLTRECMKGVYVIIPTPFDRNAVFLEDHFRLNVRRLCEIGIHAIVTTGGQGEFHSIPWEAHKRLIRALAEETAGTQTVSVVGCSGVHTEETIERTQYAQECGIDAAMNVSPYYVELTHRELVEFWRDLAQACPNIGLVIYNNATTGQLHDFAAYQEISKIPTVCGSKEGHHNFALLYRLLRETDLAIMTPLEQFYFVPSMQLGAKGIFSMTAAMCPYFILNFYETCKRGDWEQATQMQIALQEMWQKLDSLEMLKGYHAIPRFKAIVNGFGFLKCGVTRRPFIPVPDEIQKRLTDYIRDEFSEYIIS